MSKIVKMFSALFLAMFLLFGGAFAQERRVMQGPDGSLFIEKVLPIDTGYIADVGVPRLSNEQLKILKKKNLFYLKVEKSYVRWIDYSTIEIKTVEKGEIRLEGNKISSDLNKLEVRIESEKNYFFRYAAVSSLLLFSFFLLGHKKIIIFPLIISIICGVFTFYYTVHDFNLANFPSLIASFSTAFAIVCLLFKDVKVFEIFIKVAFGLLITSSVCMYFLV